MFEQYECYNTALIGIWLIYMYSPLDAACPWESCIIYQSNPSWPCYNIYVYRFHWACISIIKVVLYICTCDILRYFVTETLPLFTVFFFPQMPMYVGYHLSVQQFWSLLLLKRIEMNPYLIRHFILEMRRYITQYSCHINDVCIFTNLVLISCFCSLFCQLCSWVLVH